MTTAAKKDFSVILRTKGLKATPGRLALLTVLADTKEPLATPEITATLGAQTSQATVYRALETLADADLVRRVDLRHQHAHYELATPDEHHHHLICKNCGKIEDLADCDISDIEERVARHSKNFATITSHSLEFFGLCKQCTRKKQ